MIILDIDGVIVDFHTSFCKLFNLDVSGMIPGKWEFKDAFPQLKHLNSEDFYRDLEFDFWSQLEWMFDGQAILELLENRVGRDNIVLWSTPTRNVGCIPGKIEWIRRNMNPHYLNPNHLIFGGRKELGVSLGTGILIDDKDSNVAKFVTAGGCGILVPRIWNSFHNLNIPAINFIEKQLDCLHL